MVFSEFPYERVDLQAEGEKIDALIEQFKNAATAQEAIACVEQFNALQHHAGTMRTISNIRASVNTADPFYDQEQKYYGTHMPAIQQKTVVFQNLMLESPFRAELEQEYPPVAFSNAEIAARTISPEVLELLGEESRLVREFQKMNSSIAIELNGKTMTSAQVIPFKQSTDREERIAAVKAEGKACLEHAEELDYYYDELVKVRTAIARKLGHEKFTPLGYDRMARNGYGPADVAAFRQQVKDVLVPLCTKLKKAQSGRLGLEKLGFWDDDLHTNSGNAAPILQGDPLYQAGVQMYRDMHPDTAAMIDRMDSLQTFDLVSKKGKRGGGFCTRLMDYKVPFIFANWNGTAGDVKVFTHEGGHAFNGWLMMNREKTPISLARTTNETAEVHTMSMEFMSWKFMERFYGENADKARVTHLLGALYFIPYGCMVDEFQHIVYDNPDMTPAQRHEVWADLEKQYRPWIDFTGAPFFEEGRTWQRKHHIYNYPFYYIDYCLAQTVALEVLSIMLEKGWDAAWEVYVNFTKQFGDDTFVNMLANAGLHNPFKPGTLQNTLAAIEKFVDENLHHLK